MSDHQLEKLLGGFAADTLTPEERQQLFTAALQDQQLFDALADEQALKELLADPAVRRRLLQALTQPGASGAGGSLSWLDWFRRPANLALAGGVAVAIFAVVLGTRLYQESLQQTAQSTATEEVEPAAPPAPAPSTAQPVPPQAAAPQVKAKANGGPMMAAPRKDAFLDKTAKREKPVAAFPPREQRTPDTARDTAQPLDQRDAARRQLDAPTAPLEKTAEQATASAGRQVAASTPPPASAPIPPPKQAPFAALIAGTVAPPVSARALFYGELGRRDAQETDRTIKPLAESAPQTGRLERKPDQFSALAGKAAGTTEPVKPLGLRYSFVIRGSDGQEREVDASAAMKQGGPVELIVESNQDSYMQIWRAVESSTPQLFFPEKETGRISTTLPAGQRRSVMLPAEPGSLTVRLARTPFDSITRQESVRPERPSPHQILETVTTGTTTGLQEQATYVVNQDASPTSVIVVDIPLSQ